MGSHGTYHYAHFKLLSTIGMRELEDRVSIERRPSQNLVPVTTIARNTSIDQSILYGPFVTDVEISALHDHEYADSSGRGLLVVLMRQF